MKKFFALIAFAIFFLSVENCLAMTFQKSVKLGDVSQAGPYGININGASAINATSGKNLGKQKTYLKGSARFGNTLYFYFDFEGDVSKFGNSSKNSVSLYALEGGTEIYKIQNDKNLELYLFATDTGGGGTNRAAGLNKDGKWVIYFDTQKVLENYYGRARDVYLSRHKLQGDTIIFDITAYNENLKKTVKVGELRFRWDEKANWFGVEKI